MKEEFNYNLDEIAHNDETSYGKRVLRAIADIGTYLNKRKIFIAFVLVFVSSLAQVITPYLIGRAIDNYLLPFDLHGLLTTIGILLVIYLISVVGNYYEQVVMGNETQNALYKMRATIFNKLLELPIAFFNQNKTGDLMSLVNNDTDKVSQFLSGSFARFAGSFVTLLGIAIFALYLNLKLGLIMLASAFIMLVLSRFFSPMLESANRSNSKAVGAFTAGVQENITNFKAIVVFNKRNYFENTLTELSDKSYKAAIKANFGNKILEPIFDFAGFVAQVAVLTSGIYFITEGQLTVGLLITFITYTLRFYDPLQYFATILSELQIALGAWSRIQDILNMKSNMVRITDSDVATAAQISHTQNEIMLFDEVSFGYTPEYEILHKVSFNLEAGKTYALVGPTGGGKSTTASLMSRLYDPTKGTIYFKGKDIRLMTDEERADHISLILQDPYIFEGTVLSNVVYGNKELENKSHDEIIALCKTEELDYLTSRFEKGLDTEITVGGENISLGQRQLISFLRIALRKPDLLILDEATANIDTVTETYLQKMIDGLPESTTKVIIAHRLHTIQKADFIFFINGGNVEHAKNLAEATQLIKDAKRSS